MSVDYISESPAQKGNPIRGRFNAGFFSLMDGYLNWLLSAQKTKLFKDLPPEIVELGSGVGANFRYMKPGTKLTAIEPNPHMHNGLARRAQQYGIDLHVAPTSAERIELPDNSADTIICTLVLCTVDDPAQVVREVRRILKPGGEFLFLEHVVAPTGSWRRVLQNSLHSPWHYCFEGCHTNRDTASLLRDAGFRSVDIEPYTMRGPFIPVNSQICGRAVA